MILVYIICHLCGHASHTYTDEHVIATVHATTVKCDTESSYTSYCLFVISLLNRTMHHIVPTNEHQDGSVACNDSCDRNESFAFAISNVIEEFFSDSIKFRRPDHVPDHVLFTDVHTVLPAGRTVACKSQLCEGKFIRSSAMIKLQSIDCKIILITNSGHTSYRSVFAKTDNLKQNRR